MTNLALKDRIIPWYFVAFFVFIALVDGIMVTLAVRTNSGLVTDHPYEKGLAYNDVVAAKNRQDALGWHASIAWDGKALHVKMTDSKGESFRPEKILASFSRPAQSGMDFGVEIAPEGSLVTFPARGVWDVRISTAYQGNMYQESRRLVIE